MITTSKNVIVKVALELQTLCVFEKHGNLGRSNTEFALSHEELTSYAPVNVKFSHLIKTLNIHPLPSFPDREIALDIYVVLERIFFSYKIFKKQLIF